MSSLINALRATQNRVVELLIILFLICLFGFKVPLAGVHWDVPIYLYQSKLVVEAGIVDSYSKFSHEVADQVRNHRWSEEESFPEPYWHFSRLGNSLLLALIVYVVGDNYLAIIIASWIYSVLLTLSLLFALSFVRSVNSLLEPPMPVPNPHVLAVVSVFLYGMSDIYEYMSGNLVSEVPSLFFLTASMTSLVKAFQRESYVWAIVSGILAFLMYLVRMESIWAYVTGSATLFLCLRAQHRLKHGECILLVVGVAAGILYSFYAWWFYPLTNPLLILLFARALHGLHRGASPVMFMIASGGLLWVGFVLSLWRFNRSAVVQFALVWLALQYVPFAVSAMNGMPGETRMYTLTMPSLMLLSTHGLAVLLDFFSRPVIKAGILLATFLLLIVSNSSLYPMVRSLPGMWRLDGLREYLSPPRYQKMIYPLNELREISALIYGSQVPVVFVRNKNIPQDYTNLIRYFGPPVVARNDIALVGDPTNGGDCSQKVLKNANEQVVFCTQLSENNLATLEGRRLLVMEPKDRQGSTGLRKRKIFEAGNITIFEVSVPG